MQVSIATQTPGVVVITVTGFNVPKGPQNYSLAVQGDFTGVLASPRNPSWNRTSATNCSLPLTQITGGPLGLVNSTTANFTFTSNIGRSPQKAVARQRINMQGRHAQDQGCRSLHLTISCDGMLNLPLPDRAFICREGMPRIG